MAARGPARAGGSAKQGDPEGTTRGLVPNPSRGPLGGFRNLAGKENKDWVSDFSWLVHGVIWLILVAGTPLVVSFVRTRISDRKSVV